MTPLCYMSPGTAMHNFPNSVLGHAEVPSDLREALMLRQVSDKDDIGFFQQSVAILAAWVGACMAKAISVSVGHIPCVGSPLQISHVVILSIAVFVVDKVAAWRLFNESKRYKTMRPPYCHLCVLAQCELEIAVPGNEFAYAPLNNPLATVNPHHASKRGHGIGALITRNWFPFFDSEGIHARPLKLLISQDYTTEVTP